MQIAELAEHVTRLMENATAPIHAYKVRSVVREDMQKELPLRDLVCVLTSEKGLRNLAQQLRVDIQQGYVDLAPEFIISHVSPIGKITNPLYLETVVQDMYKLKAYAQVDKSSE